MDFTFSSLLGIAGAAVLGGIIGVQRQSAGKAAGFRTHLLVAAASAAFTAMGAHLNDTRIPSYVVVGIGFLGAGAIVREGTTPRGLTTAASIWMSAAIGLLMGYANSFGLYAALLSTAITLIALIASDHELMMVFRIPGKAQLRVFTSSAGAVEAQLEQSLRASGVGYEKTGLNVSIREGAIESSTMHYVLSVRRGVQLATVMHSVAALSGVDRVEADEANFGG